MDGWSGYRIFAGFEPATQAPGEGNYIVFSIRSAAMI